MYIFIFDHIEINKYFIKIFNTNMLFPIIHVGTELLFRLF